MIDYETFCQIRLLYDKKKMNAAQISRELDLDIKTVLKWVERSSYHPRKRQKRVSKLDVYKKEIVRLLETHPYSAAQIFQSLKEQGYLGGYSILKEFVGQVRPSDGRAYLSLAFAPGECVQVDWGSFGSVTVGSTRRRLSFLVMVLCYSRLMYVEFTLGQSQDQFLACQKNAFEFFGGVPEKVMIDNLKSAVLARPLGEPALFHPRYMDFARHYGFTIAPCGVRKPHQKGRVENGVGYVKKNFLQGLSIPDFSVIGPAARLWLQNVANTRLHGETRKKPIDLFAEEKSKLKPLAAAPYDVGVIHQVRATSRFRVIWETNRYSVPAEYAGARLTLKVDPQHLWFYHNEKPIADHVRSYDRHQDFENPDHVKELLLQRREARQQKLLMRFLALSPFSETYYRQMEVRRLNAGHHVQKIVALSEIHGEEKVARAIQDACSFQAYSCEYIANILETRSRVLPEPGALHLMRRQDLLELEMPPADLSLYDNPQETPNPEK